MLQTVQRLGAQLIDAEISIPQVLEKVARKADTLKELWGVAREYIDKYVPAFVFALILLGLSLLETFVGKKLLGFQKFVICSVFGFIVGTAYVHPIITTMFTVDKLIIGGIVALIAGCLCRPIYFCGYVGVIGYFTYFIMMNGCPIEATKGNKIIAVITAAALITFCLIFRKVVEIAGTSVVGAVFTYLSVDFAISALFDGKDIKTLLGDNALIVAVAAITVVAICGFVVQYRRRRRW